MTEYKLFAQRVGLVGITNLIFSLRGLILIPILTKTLGADAYGIWSVIMVTISLLSPLALLGLTSAWDREKSTEFIIPEFTELGYNYKMSDITAAVGVTQLKRLEKIIEKKRALAKYWDEKLQEIEFIEPPYVSENVKHIYQSYVALVDRHINRNKLIVTLMKRGIQTQIGTYASHIQPVYNSNQKCPNSLEIFNRSLALPMY